MSDGVLLVVLTVGGTLVANYFMTRSMVNYWISDIVDWMNDFVMHYGQHIHDCHTDYKNIIESEFLDLSKDNGWAVDIDSKEYIESLILYSELEEHEDKFTEGDENE